MAYQRKQWQFNDIITEGELNRMEAGIEESFDKAESAQQTAQQASQTAAQTANALAAHLAETTQNAHLAKNIGIEDAAGNFTATDVEGALAELFQYANDGKTLIANAITAKGVPASPTEPFASLASKIGQISTGKKFATGVVRSSSSQLQFVQADGTTINSYYVTVNGLAFTPSLILLVQTETINETRFTIYLATGFIPSGVFRAEIVRVFTSASSIGSSNLIKKQGNAYVSSGSFQLPVFLFDANMNWWAFE